MESVNKIYTRYPELKKKKQKATDPKVPLTTKEAVFIQLINFFERPSENQFSLNTLYEHLEDEELLFALEVIISFFQNDTKLVHQVHQTFYDENFLKESFVGQQGFSTMVESAIKDIKFKPAMVHVYWKRKSDKVPKPDLMIEGRPYWKESTVKKFIQKKKRELKRKNE